MFLDSFRITLLAVAQIFVLGAIGYVLVKKNILGEDGLDSLSRLVINVIFPFMIFSQLISNFSFAVYKKWWIFPLTSLIITIAGFLVGVLFIKFIKGDKHKLQFLSLVTFQNSGYLPLAMVAALFPRDKAGPMFIYIFLFLLGFDLIFWSVGVYMLRTSEKNKFEWKSLFSPPVIANLVSLSIVFLGLNRFIPGIIARPAAMIGNCTLPLAMFVVGGNLAVIHLRHVDKKAIFYVVLSKLIILPALGLLLIILFKVPELFAFLILMQLTMPPATSLSVVIRHYKQEDLYISQGIFFGHILSLITIPLFLSLYFAFTMLK